jgi:hypothetical protein
MADSDNTDALVAGLAWLPWSDDPSADCPPVIVQFFEGLEIDVSMALHRSSRKTELSEWLKNQFGHSHLEKVRWFEVGIHTMVAFSMFASGVPPKVAEDAMTAYRAVLEEAGVSLGARDQIAALVRGLAVTPLDQQIFARLLERVGEQSRMPSASPLLKWNIHSWAAAPYYLTVAVVIITALAAFSKSSPPFTLPFLLVAGLLLTTAIGGFGAFRD